MRDINDIKREWEAGSLPNSDVDDLIQFVITQSNAAPQPNPLRDHFAGLAMQGLVRKFAEDEEPIEELASFAYDIADAMLAKRGK